MYRILHISDLHRSPDDAVDNNALVAALDCDFESQRLENPVIGHIDAIIVSGDVVWGVPLGEPDYQNKIREQYHVATEFLDTLSKRYLSGDRSKIIVAPGNHDVDWNTAVDAMSEIPSGNQETDLLKYIRQPNFRFCYRTRKLFYIKDLVGYEHRFDEFNRFISEFYKNSNLSFPVFPNRYFNLFELNNGRIAVAAFNSCYQNDCYRYSGSIPDGAIGDSYLQIKDAGRDYDLRLAVWHHSLYGPPNETDYMDVERIREMASCDFQLGLHGHQHKAGVHPERIYLPDEKYMIVVSAGSLCVGARELPVGEKRQYNIIEVNSNYASVRVHVREMIFERVFGPRKLPSFGGKSYIDIACYPAGDNRATKRILRAESLIAQREYESAVNELIRNSQEISKHGRRLLLKACEDGRLWNCLVKYCGPPTTISELLSLVHAHEELGKCQEGKRVLGEYAEFVNLPEIQKQEVETRLDLAIRVKS